MSTRRIVLLTTLLCACSPQELQPVDSKQVFITGGQRATGYPAVGLLHVGNSICTATLVGKKTVLTAAHCLAKTQMVFVLDNGEQVGVTKATLPSEYQGQGSSYDIGVVQLATAPSVAPMPIATRAPVKGEKITLVGYGSTQCQQKMGGVVDCTQDAGVKREAENTISDLDTIDFAFNGLGSTCKGDSGGPAFALQGSQLVQLGVTSRGAMPCGTQAIDTRVDVFADWIHKVANGDVVKAATQPDPKPDPQPDPKPDPQPDPKPDPQPDPQPDPKPDPKPDPQPDPKPDPKPDPQPDPSDSEPPATLDPGSTSEPDPTLTPDPSDEDAPSPGAFGASCDEGSDCDSWLCINDPFQGKQYCSQDCAAAAGGCPNNAECRTAGGGISVCAESLATRASMAEPELLGGCNVAASDGALGPVACLSLLFLMLYRRRR